ncbi:hypothetical protein [Acinetobacter rudis]|uniref:Uncharacterized protein n=1 Tax=Acinetobacter rudis CIP 110305 TaxID=421052 RepID=S3NXY7_9GAMM|nr:hypothetical protein [Acinetobacter rudis]EPF71506.1 hypothetical protein F945_02535 [Acinetobacter rudis CIP 110305]
MNNQNKPEIIIIEDQNFGSHIEHWSLLSPQATTDVPKWLGMALDAPIMPMGLCEKECDMDQHMWLIQGPSHAEVMFNQIVSVENNKPKAVKTAFPSFHSPYNCNAKISRIISCKSNTQAVLQLQLGPNSTVYAFDQLYSVNHDFYQADEDYQVQLNGWAYALEKVSDHDSIVVDDPASIRHHHALNDILAEHDGVSPDNLQELIDAWQPKTAEELEPVTVDFSKMVAYLYGETLGQEDEAWFQGKIVGKTNMPFMQQNFTLYDVTLFLEPDQPATLIRIATQEPELQNFEIGQYIRGNIWVQATIHSLAEQRSPE